MPRYVVEMSNGDTGECDSIASAMTAAATMFEDGERSAFVATVTRNGQHCVWATAACRHHIEEKEGGMAQ